MTSPSVLLVALLALLSAVGAAVSLWPRPVALDGRRWFKTLLARALVREAADPALVPFHPLERWVERKLAHPGLESMPGALLDGEAELLLALQALPDAAARWAFLTEGSARHLVGDASALGAQHAPSRWLGPTAGWDAATRDGAARMAEERLHATWALVAGEPLPGVPDLGVELARFAQVVPWRPGPEASLEEAVAHVAAALKALLPPDDRRQRLVLAGTGEGVPVLLRVLRTEVELRDRVLAVVSVHGGIGGWPGRTDGLGEEVQADWLEAHFRHEALDVEVVKRVPYLAMQWLDPVAVPPGAGGLPLARARFPEPGFVGREPEFLEVVDLGPLAVAPRPPLPSVARALRLVTDLYALARR